MIRKILSYLPSTITPLLVNFVLVFIYAGKMSPADYGIYNVYLNSISLIYAVALSFLNSSSFRFYSIKGLYEDEREYYSTFYVANLALCALIAVVLLLANLVVKFDWAVVAFAVTMNALYQFDVNMYRLRDRTIGYTFARLSASFGALGFISACVALSVNVDYSIPIYTFYGAYAFTIIVEFVRCAPLLSVRHVSRNLFVESIKFGMPMMGVNVIGLLISYSAQYVILYFLSKEAVGYYSLGFRLSDTVISNITMIILTVMTPVLMRVYDEAKGDRTLSGSAMITKLINLDVWVVLPICVMLAYYAEDIIRLLFPSYEGAQLVVQIVVLSAVLRSLSMITCKGLELARETKRVFQFLVISLIVNLGYSLLFVPIYGVLAAGHASILAYLVYNALLIKESASYVPVNIDWRYFMKVMVLSLAIACLAVLLRSLFSLNDIGSLLAQGCACAIAYLIASIAAGLYKQFLGLSD